MVATLRSNIVRIIFALALLAGMIGAAPVPSVDASTGAADPFTATLTPEIFTLTLQPNAAAGLDSFIYSITKTTNYGSAVTMGVGEDNNANNRLARSLIKFDLSSIPSNATITSATLSLWTSADLSSNDRTIRVYRLKVPFNELQVSWNRPMTGRTWQVAGASGSVDRESVDIGSVFIANSGPLNAEKQIVLTPARIQELVNGSFANHGFILVADSELNDRFNYSTSDSTIASQRPKLFVQYSLASATPTQTATSTPTRTSTATWTTSVTATHTFTPTSTATSTSVPTVPPTETLVPAHTFTDSPAPTLTHTFQPTASATSTATETAQPTPTFTDVPTDTATNTPEPTFTPVPTMTSTGTPEPTFTTAPTLTVHPTASETVEATSTPVPTFTGTSVPSVTPTSSLPPMGPLSVSAVNPRYFADPSGKIVYLTGSHTWCNFMDCDDTATVTAKFNYTAYLDFLESNNHNFFRLWRAENARGGEAGPNFWFDPMPYARSTTCCALDGGNKFDLTQFNQDYFDRMRERVIQARERGMYVSIMLFDGWSVESKFSGHEPWPGHPYNVNNNVNSIDGDLNDDNQGGETHTLALPEIIALQEAYVRKVIDTVNDLDNVLYEISNESPANSEAWQYHMVSVVRNYEATKALSHPVGVTWEWPGGNNADLYNSPADWISLGGGVDLNTYVPPASDGAKVILADTDHLCGICGNRQWVWKSFTRGENPIFMDNYDQSTSGRGIPFANPAETEIRLNLGYARSYAARMNLAAMNPQPALCSTGYCLASLSSWTAEVLAFLPGGGSINIDLSATQATLSVEWLNLATGLKTSSGTVNGAAIRQLTAPFSGDAVLYLYDALPQTPTVSPVPSLTATMTVTVPPVYTETPLPTHTSTALPPHTVSPTAPPTAPATPTPSATPSWTPTSTATGTPTATASPTSTATRTPTASPAGSFPRTGLLDTFDRANGNLGNNWSGHTSAYRVASNQLDVYSGGWNTYVLWRGTSFGGNQEAFVRFTQLDAVSGNEHSLVLKSQSNNTNTGLIYVQYDAVNHMVQVWTYHPNQDWVQHGTNIPVTFVAGDQFGARARSDGTVEIYKNGTLVATRSITSWPYYANGGHIGVWFVNATGAMADDFGGGTVP